MQRRAVVFFQQVPPQPGAVSLRAYSILCGISKNLSAYDISVFSCTHKPLKIQGIDYVFLSTSSISNSRPLYCRLIWEFRLGFVSAKRMFFGRGRPDLAILSSPSYICVAIQALVAQLRGVPYVLDVRDLYPQTYVEAGLLVPKGITYRFLMVVSRSMYRNASLILCATENLKRKILQQSGKTSLICIYNGFPAHFLDRVIVKSQRFTVCFHGVLGFFQDAKNLLLVTEKLLAFDVDVVVIGYGRNEKILERCDLPNLRFLGRQSFEATIDEVEKSHLGLSLRLDDGISKGSFPVKVWEYLGLGIPCIVSPPSEAGDFLIKHKCGFAFEYGNVSEIVDLIVSLKDDRERLQSLSKNCRLVARGYTREYLGDIAAKAILKTL